MVEERAIAKRRRLAPMGNLIAKIRSWLGLGKDGGKKG
jgi:hypothetical protein